MKNIIFLKLVKNLGYIQKINKIFIVFIELITNELLLELYRMFSDFFFNFIKLFSLLVLYFGEHSILHI